MNGTSVTVHASDFAERRSISAAKMCSTRRFNSPTSGAEAAAEKREEEEEEEDEEEEEAAE